MNDRSLIFFCEFFLLLLFLISRRRCSCFLHADKNKEASECRYAAAVGLKRCNALNQLDYSSSRNIAPSNFYAPWSGLGSARPSPSTSVNVTRRGIITIDWNQFKQFLLQRTNAKTATERIRYAKQFATVLQTGDAQPLLQMSPDRRIHTMKGLASLSRFLGCYSDTWLAIRQRYNLKWSTGNENLAAFTRFFDDNKTLDSMLDWVRRAIKALPAHMCAVVKFNVLTGLRPSEAVESVRLLKCELSSQYYNPERQCLEHFRFPEIFLRRTKSAYISIIELNQLSGTGVLDCKTLYQAMWLFNIG
jgi:hypothetical protein